MALDDLVKHIKIDFNDEVLPSHVKSTISNLIVDFEGTFEKIDFNYSENDICLKVLISSSVEEQSNYDYQVIVGDHNSDILQTESGLILNLNFSEIGNVLPDVLKLIEHKVQEKIKINFEEQCFRTLKTFKREMDISSSLNGKYIQLKKEVELLILKKSSFKSLKDQINSLDLINELGFSIVDVFDTFIDKSSNLFPIFINNEKFYAWALSWQGKNELPEEIIEVIGMLKDHYELTVILESKTGRFNVWEAAVEKLPVGVVVIDSKDNIRIYNQKFIDLNVPLKSVEGLGDREFLKLGDDSFQVLVSSMQDSGETYRIYLFEKITDQLEINGYDNNEELGIICSSLAHELNNPIAGILASLTVIELEDEEKVLKLEIEDMKKGVMRCKQLVETFLGFSKSKKFESAKTVGGGLKSSLHQALDLMRFRMIESNMSLQISYREDQKYKEQLDFSLMVMMNYLFLGEILTALSHYNLLTEQSIKTIQLNVIENKDKIFISWAPRFSLSSEFTTSPLFLHLLDSQGINLIFDEGSVIFSATSDFEESEYPLA